MRNILKSFFEFEYFSGVCPALNVARFVSPVWISRQPTARTSSSPSTFAPAAPSQPHKNSSREATSGKKQIYKIKFHLLPFCLAPLFSACI
jgi:hypothetical protein